MSRPSHLIWSVSLWLVLSLLASAAVWVGSGVIADLRADAQVESWCAEDYELDETTASVFAPSKLLTFEFTLAPEDLAHMRSDPRAEEYVPAQLELGLEVVGLVGLRFKGDGGTLFNYEDEHLPPDNLPKLSLKVHFGKFAKGQRFRGLERLNFHSMSNDPSLMRDRIAYGSFRAAGVQAPRSGHARVVVNGEFQGVFAMVEQVDWSFVEEHLHDAGPGVLYKEVWPQWASAGFYRWKIKEDPAESGVAPMLALAAELREAQESELPDVLGKYCDMDSMLRYLVVDQILCNWDGATRLRSRLSAPTRNFFNHNYYWYQSSLGKLTLIPWDLDQTLQLDHPYSAVPSFSELDANPEILYPGYEDAFAIAPASDPLIRAVALYARGRFANEVESVLAGVFAVDYLEAKIAEWTKLLRPSLALDPHVDLADWDRGVRGLRLEIGKIHAWMAEVVAENGRESK